MQSEPTFKTPPVSTYVDAGTSCEEVRQVEFKPNVDYNGAELAIGKLAPHGCYDGSV